MCLHDHNWTDPSKSGQRTPEKGHDSLVWALCHKDIRRLAPYCQEDHHESRQEEQRIPEPDPGEPWEQDKRHGIAEAEGQKTVHPPDNSDFTEIRQLPHLLLNRR